MDHTSPASVRTRQHYSREFKSRVVAEARQPHVSIASVALSHGLNANLLRRWIQDADPNYVGKRQQGSTCSNDTAALQMQGVRFALDDFGTGYSSLSYLRKLPLDQLKIDKSFVCDVLTNTNDAAIVGTILSLANNLGLNLVAEGVETQEQLDFLVRHGCQFFQGHLFSPALPEDQLRDTVAMGNAN